MVTIVDYATRVNSEGKAFMVLILQGGIEMVKSKTTGNYYATAKRASVTSTFAQNSCIDLIGQKLPGTIKRQSCEPYNYVVKDTGEVITLEHRWIYLPEGDSVDAIVREEQVVKTPVF